MSPSNALAAALGLSLIGTALEAQDHGHGGIPERLGTVHFATSCATAVAARFDRAVALLHSFELGAAIRGFEEVAAADSACAMAWWGISLSRWSNPMVPGIRPPAVLARGREAALRATRLAAAPTVSERERAYVAAVSELFAESHRDQRARLLAYERAMEQVAAANPDDDEAKIFYAIALVPTALPSDKTYANQLKAGAILEGLFARNPDHPGLAHYIIHSYDVPALAGRAADAARRYADIAPSAAHALHMPSHTFTRVGMWKESVATNLRSRSVATRDGSIGEALHASDYAMYAYLQMRQDSGVRAILRDVPALAARFDPNVVSGAAPPSAGLFALAAIPARYALERRAWKEAVALTPARTDVPYADALTYFARALGAARDGDTASARASIAMLDSLRARLAAAGEPYWTEQVDIQRIGADAWVDFAARRRDDAIAKMREAATREDATEKAAVTPGPLAPAREMLAEMLMAAGRPADALTEYRKALTREPNRYWSLRGAAEAAAASGDRSAEASYRAQLTRLVSKD